jgi:hypothetical protein
MPKGRREPENMERALEAYSFRIIYSKISFWIDVHSCSKFLCKLRPNNLITFYETGNIHN